MYTPIFCPKCGIFLPTDALVCACGHDLSSAPQSETEDGGGADPDRPLPLQPREVKPHQWILLIICGLIIAIWWGGRQHRVQTETLQKIHPHRFIFQDPHGK
jgi:hypothetical protein